MTTTFEKPQEALSYIKANYPMPGGEKTILLLDINMPVLSGWDFIQEILAFSPPIIDHFSIYIQSSSVDFRDLEKANENPHIVDFISKPLKKEFLASLSHTAK
jgi:CheY-like chemotaxis protein